jgi:GNAT superfamily N-acetyltransferase
VWLAHDAAGDFVAEIAGRPVGLVTTTCYARTAWIGNLIVVPEHRRQGIGRTLMKRALAHLASRGVGTIRLEADPPGIPLYRSLGFVDEFESFRYRRPPEPRVGGAAAERIAWADLPAIAHFDTERFGDDRGRMLTLLHRVVKQTYWVREGRRPRGYAFVLPSRFGARLGPWVADGVHTADTLLQAALGDWGDKTILLGVPAPNRDAVGLLAANGFERTPSCVRMVNRGPRATGSAPITACAPMAGRPQDVYGIGHGATG